MKYAHIATLLGPVDIRNMSSAFILDAFIKYLEKSILKIKVAIYSIWYSSTYSIFPQYILPIKVTL